MDGVRCGRRGVHVQSPHGYIHVHAHPVLGVSRVVVHVFRVRMAVCDLFVKMPVVCFVTGHHYPQFCIIFRCYLKKFII